jgi:hypothetical protein
MGADTHLQTSWLSEGPQPGSQSYREARDFREERVVLWERHFGLGFLAWLADVQHGRDVGVYKSKGLAFLNVCQVRGAGRGWSLLELVPVGVHLELTAVICALES